MGGSGGGGWYSSMPSTSGVEKAVSDATTSSEYEAEANAYMQDLLASYNSRDVEAIQKHLMALEAAIKQDIDGDTSILFGGSVKKHTYVDGLSDVDILMVVNGSSLADCSAKAVLSYFAERIKAQLPDTEIKTGTLAITVKYTDGTELQLLPALRTQADVRIASADGSGWSNVVRPQEFAKRLTEVNQVCGRKVVPVVKLFKGLQSALPTTSQIKGYHVESLAIEAFKNYVGRQTYKDMLLHFVRVASRRVLSPINDTTGQSLHVDDYLGPTSGADRTRVSKTLDRLANRLATADSRASLSDLVNVFGE
ncbi:nucleotidyltransferase [Synechococcus sp. CS-1328]|nr:nucleotidyltransferase [Synechococcus sp. CS-1328]